MSPALEALFEVLHEERDLIEAADVDGLAELQDRKRTALERVLQEATDADKRDVSAARAHAAANASRVEKLVAILQRLGREMREAAP